MNLGAFVAQVWLEVRPIRRWKAKRAAKKAAKHPEAAEAVNGEYFTEAQEGGSMLKGKLTYASIAALAFGLVSTMIGVDIAPTEVDAIVTALATVTAIYGRWRATKG